MSELLKSAWLGWQEYMTAGKYAALLLLVLFFLWFRKEGEKEKPLLIYTTLVTILCIFPVSAAVLMAYQTGFYNYKWIWSYVPLTLLIAYGGTIFLTEYWERYKKKVWQCVGITAAVLTLGVLCGSMGQDVFDGGEKRQEREAANTILEALRTEADAEEICLWAPKEIMASARAFDGKIQLIYGRNMWDAALGAYSYDTYSESEKMLYLWMCNAEESGMVEYAPEELTQGVLELSLEAILETAKAAGVNRILLPGNILPEELENLARAWKVQPRQLGAYYLITITNNENGNS